MTHDIINTFLVQETYVDIINLLILSINLEIPTFYAKFLFT